MRIFICRRTSDAAATNAFAQELITTSEYALAVVQEVKDDDAWQTRVKQHIRSSDLVVFALGSDTFASPPMLWELDLAQRKHKHIVGLRLGTFDAGTAAMVTGIRLVASAQELLAYIERFREKDRELLIDQYKIISSSTETVASQRLLVHNIFLAITSSVMTIAFVAGNAFDFSIVGNACMFGFTILAFLITFTWEEMVDSYGKLNKGKFRLLYELEKRLHTNLFDAERDILENEVEYKAKHRSEIRSIEKCRIVIMVVLVIELALLLRGLSAAM